MQTTCNLQSFSSFLLEKALDEKNITFIDAATMKGKCIEVVWFL